MKKLILALTVMCLTGVVYANQQCFYGKNCLDGKAVKQERMHKKAWMTKACKCKMGEEGKECKCAKMTKKEGCPMMHKKMVMKKKGGCPMMKEKMAAKKEGCAMKKEGKKPCGRKHKMKKGKKDGSWKEEGKIRKAGKKQDYKNLLQCL